MFQYVSGHVIFYGVPYGWLSTKIDAVQEDRFESLIDNNSRLNVQFCTFVHFFIDVGLSW